MDQHAERELAIPADQEIARGLREGSGQCWRTFYDAFALRVLEFRGPQGRTGQ